jgi:Cd2+/Zn2+-exporting ATPase
MEGRQSKTLVLEGLDCVNCASGIENDLKKLKGVSNAAINFASKTLFIEATSASQLEFAVQSAKLIALDYDAKIIIKENTPRMQTIVFYLEGLDCADCANKIESATGQLKGVRSSNMDFVFKKLSIQLANSQNINKITAEVKKIVMQIDSRIRVNAQDSNNNTQNKIHKLKIVTFVISTLLFAAALLIPASYWVRFGIFFICYLLAGYEVIFSASRNMLKGRIFDENFLMMAATIGAFSIGEFPEAAAVMLFYNIGELFQQLAVNRSRRSIGALMDIRPDYANLIIDGDIKKISPEDASIGDLIIVKPGEKIPLDGRIHEGLSTLDTSALTGEALPRNVKTGDDVLSGSVNQSGLLTVEVTKPFGESTVSKILDLVQNAGSNKAPTENFITKFARIYTPAVVITALLLAILPPLLLPGAVFADWLNRALVFLVISCPCALVVSIPLGFFGGIGSASRNGILIKGGNFLEALNNVDTVVFDKTGTLTKGVFKVTNISGAEGIENDILLEYAAYAESYSNHPIALSIRSAYGKELNKDEIENYNEITGYGVKATVRGKEVLAGNSRLMGRESIPFSPADNAGTVVYLAVDRQYAGYIVISDEIKDDAAKAIQGLRKSGVRRLVMLTGDSKSIAQKIGTALSLDDVYSELLPDQKVAELEKMEQRKSAKGKLIFMGDGINDAPVLARADVGVAMGGLGSDAAIEAADIVLMTDEPSKLIQAIRIAKKTRKIIWQNIIFALGVKLIVLVLGAGGIATMWEAVFADVGVALIAVINAMRIIRSKL